MISLFCAVYRQSDLNIVYMLERLLSTACLFLSHMKLIIHRDRGILHIHIIHICVGDAQLFSMQSAIVSDIIHRGQITGNIILIMKQHRHFQLIACLMHEIHQLATCFQSGIRQCQPHIPAECLHMQIDAVIIIDMQEITDTL